MPPTLVLHGTADETVPHEQAVRFVEAIREKGGVARLKSYDGRGHGFFNKRNGTDDYDATVAVADRFLSELGYLDS